MLCTLPALEHPLTDLVNDALKQIFGREGKKELSEFREQVENGTVIPLFVLDGYDELKQEHLGSNLYETNDLQDYIVEAIDNMIEDKVIETNTDGKSEEKDKKNDVDKTKIKEKKNFPKVIYLCRTEFLATKPNAYREWFRPGADIKADGLLMERLIASFDTAQREEYFAARVTRNFAELICDVLGVDKMDFVLKEMGMLEKEVTPANKREEDKDDEKRKSIQLQNILSYTKSTKAIYTSSIQSIAEKIQNKCIKKSTSNDNKHKITRAFIFSTLVASLDANKKQYDTNNVDACWKQIQDLAIKGRSNVWPISEFQEAFERMKELEELTKTPFMLKICTDVIDLLRAMGATPARIKERTILSSKTQHHHNDSHFTSVARNTTKSVDKRNVSLKQRFSNAIHSNKFNELAIKETADDLWRLIKTNGMLDHLKEIQEWIDIYTEKKSADLETKVDKKVIQLLKTNKSLLKILKRTPVDRYRIYKTFIRYYIQAEAQRKHSNAISVIELDNEAYEFSTQLALEMTEENLTKVRYEQGQHRFREKTRWERFLGENGEAMEMIRRVAPIQKGK